MQGTLDSFSIVEILQMLGKARHSGTLHIECPSRMVDVHFVGGRIAETRDSTRVATDTVLGSLLLRRALVNDPQLTDALGEQERQPGPLGTILVDRGALHERDLREVLSRQVAGTLVAAKVEPDGEFVFMADDDPQPVDFITIETQAVLMDISSLGGDYCLAVEVLGQANTVVVRNADYDSLPRYSITMGRDEFMVLALVDGQRTVREITADSGLEEVTVVSTLGKLCDTGVVLVRAERHTRAAADDELQAHRDAVWAEVSQLLDHVEDPAAAPGPQDRPAAATAAPAASVPPPAAPSTPDPDSPADAGDSPDGLTARGASSAPDDIDWDHIIRE